MTTEPRSQASQRGSIPADTLANRLMLARAHAGHLSIREAADLCDIGRGAWTNWEKGARPADIIDVATVVADKLGIDRDWLLFGGDLARSEGRPIRRQSAVKKPYAGLMPSVEIASGRHLAPRPLGPGRRGSSRPASSVRPSSRRPAGGRPADRPRLL